MLKETIEPRMNTDGKTHYGLEEGGIAGGRGCGLIAGRVPAASGSNQVFEGIGIAGWRYL